MKKTTLPLRIYGSVFVLLSLEFIAGCTTAPVPKPVTKLPDFVCTNWPARQAKIKSVYLVAPAVDIVKIGYFCQRQEFTNDELQVSNRLMQLIPTEIMNQGVCVDIAKPARLAKDEQQLMDWMASAESKNFWRFNKTNFPADPIRRDVTNLAVASGDESILVIEFVGKDRSTTRVIREGTIMGFGVTGAVAGGCAGAATAQPVGMEIVGGLGFVTGAVSGWMVTGFGNVNNEARYGFGKYTCLRALLFDGKTGEVLWANSRRGEFNPNGLDTLVKAVFHQPTL